MLFSLIPDIIDKPLAWIVLALSSGRTIAHTLLFLFVISALVCVLLYKRHKFIAMGVFCSILLHQLFDSMWLNPVSWFYPLYGAFNTEVGFMNLWSVIWLEVSNPIEWVSVILVICSLYYWTQLSKKQVV